MLITDQGLTHGFSGGPVLDAAGGVVGMLIEGNGKIAYVTPWKTILGRLAGWEVRPNRVDPWTSAETNPNFVTARVLDPAQEAARAAIRRYIAVLADKRRAELLALRPTLSPAEVDALFGDAINIDLQLNGCTGVEFCGESRGEATCAYKMTVTRRTRPESPPSGSVKFLLRRERLQWVIDGLTREGATCSAR
jgi:hypothetical protein